MRSASKRRRMEDTCPLSRVLSPEECAFVQRLPTPRRHEIARRMLDMQDARPAVPRRIRVLESTLPTATKAGIVCALSAGRPTEKYAQWVDSLLDLPLGRVSRPPVVDDVGAWLRAARDMMDAHLHGQQRAKREVILMLLKWKSNPNAPLSPLGVCGLPGIGKTSFCQHVLAAVLRRPFCTIGLGGVGDASYLTGHSFTYEGSTHGMVASALKQARCMDPVLFFDEVDKVSRARSDDVSSALLHLTDPSTNGAFRDKYFCDTPLDVSRCVFCFSFNDKGALSPPLLDRLQLVPFDPPTPAEKARIAQDFLLPRALRGAGLRDGDVALSDEQVQHVICRCGDEAGVRQLGRMLDRLVCALHLRVVEGVLRFPVRPSSAMLEDALGELAIPSDAVPPPAMYA